MTVTITQGGKVIRTSKNLRGIIDHARRVGAPRNVEIKAVVPLQNDAPYFVVFYFPDGSIGKSEFQDATVARWFVQRRRSWGSVPINQRVC